MNSDRCLYKLTAELVGGTTVSEAAKECYFLGQQLGLRVNFVHNDRTYSVDLKTTQIGGPPEVPPNR